MMKSEKKKFKIVDRVKFAKKLSLIIGIIVMVGWLFNIQFLKSILPFFVTMKFTTAMSFLASGIILYFAADSERKDVSIIGLPIATFILLLLMSTLLASVIFGINTGVENLFVKEGSDAVHTTVPGRPSAGTMAGFILIGIVGLIGMNQIEEKRIVYKTIGGITGIIAIVALLGYVLNIPGLYYSIPGKSTAMAVHTAISFLILGAGFFVLGGKGK